MLNKRLFCYLGKKLDAFCFLLVYYFNSSNSLGSDDLLANITRNTRLAANLRKADSFLSRLKGLLGTASLPEGEALLIVPCSSVHTFGMSYPIDVLFVDANHRVVKVAAWLSPGRIAWHRNSSYVIELPAGTIAVSQTQAGDTLCLDEAIVDSRQHR